MKVVGGTSGAWAAIDRISWLADPYRWHITCLGKPIYPSGLVPWLSSICNLVVFGYLLFLSSPWHETVILGCSLAAAKLDWWCWGPSLEEKTEDCAGWRRQMILVNHESNIFELSLWSKYICGFRCGFYLMGHTFKLSSRIETGWGGGGQVKNWENGFLVGQPNIPNFIILTSKPS